MPVYNSEKYLDETIESIVKQTHENWELVIVNDGSNDNSINIINKWKKRDNRIFVYQNNVNRGLGYSTNKALSYAKSNIIAKIDSDDVVLSTWLEYRLNILLENKELIVVSGSRLLIDSNGKFLKKSTDYHNDVVIKFLLTFGNPVIHPGVVFRRISGEEYLPLKYFEDWELWIRMLEYGKIRIVNDFQIKYRIHSNNTSSILGKNNPQIKQIIASFIGNYIFKEFNLVINEEIIWYLYRNRAPFTGKTTMIDESINFVYKISDIFLKFNRATLENKNEDIHFAIWDEIFHILRLGPSRQFSIITFQKKYPISLLSVLVDKQKVQLLFKIIFITFLNMFRVKNN